MLLDVAALLESELNGEWKWDVSTLSRFSPRKVWRKCQVESARSPRLFLSRCLVGVSHGVVWLGNLRGGWASVSRVFDVHCPS